MIIEEGNRTGPSADKPTSSICVVISGIGEDAQHIGNSDEFRDGGKGAVISFRRWDFR